MVDFEKANTIIAYLSSRISNLYVTKLLKLLYYIDFISYAEKGVSVTGDIYFKLPYGPVPTVIKNELDMLSFRNENSDYKNSPFDNVQLTNDSIGRVISYNGKYDLTMLADYERTLIDRIIEKKKEKTASQLSSDTHKEAPYLLSPDGSEISYDFAKMLKVEEILK